MNKQLADNFPKEKLDNLLKALADLYETLSIIEIVQKHYTYFALFCVKEDFLSQA